MDEHPTTDPTRFAILAVTFELALGVVSIMLGWLTGPWPWSTLESPPPHVLYTGFVAGVATALLLFAGIVLADRKPFGIFRQLQQTVRHYLVPMFRGMSIWGFLMISLAAGIGEELLFRGYCQAALAHWCDFPGGIWLALAVASLLFGACHWVSSAYALVAAAMGLVLGGLFLATGSLVAPIIAHGLYDFLALLYLTRRGGTEV